MEVRGASLAFARSLVLGTRKHPSSSNVSLKDFSYVIQIQIEPKYIKGGPSRSGRGGTNRKVWISYEVLSNYIQ